LCYIKSIPGRLIHYDRYGGHNESENTPISVPLTVNKLRDGISQSAFGIINASKKTKYKK